jgi:spore maturation protein CgeB
MPSSTRRFSFATGFNQQDERNYVFMQKILICGHNMYEGHLGSLVKGFESFNLQVQKFEHINTNVSKLNYQSYFKRHRAQHTINEINRALIHRYNDFRPDLVLCINGEVLLPHTIETFNRSSYSALWIIDALKNIKLPLSSVEMFTKVFFFEPTDLNTLPQGVYLSQGVDDSLYTPLPRTENAYHLSFVGAGHDIRLPVLEQIAKMCVNNNLRFAVFGPFTAFKKLSKRMKLKREYPFLAKSILANQKLPPRHVNEIYNKSMINLNIHHEQSIRGLNPRTFEIMSARGFQLVDSQPELGRYFDVGREIVSYEDLEDLQGKIIYYVEHDEARDKIAQRGFEKTTAEHTYTQRCKTILESFRT